MLFTKTPYSIFTPLEQFEIYQIYSYFTSVTFTSLIIFFIIVIIINYLSSCYAIVPTRWQKFLESPFIFIKNIVTENINIKEAVYFPYIFTYFTNILSYNLIGMVPYSFTITSHLATTFYLALAAFLGINITAVKKK